MAEGVSTTILKYEFDDAAANRTKQGIAGISRAQETLTSQMNRLAAQSQLTTQELDELRQKIRSGDLQGKDLDKAIYRALQLEEQLAKTNEQLDKLSQPRSGVDIGDERFGEVSRNVGLFGDAESSLNAIRGLGDAAGLNTGGAQVVSDIFATAEALPRLKVALENLPAQALAGAQALGPTGIGLAAGILALGAAVAFFNAQNDKAAQTIRSIIGSQEEITRLRLTGTREEIEAAQEQKRVDIEVARSRIEENKRLLQGLQDQAGPVLAAIADAANLAGARELREETSKLEQELATAELEMSRLNGTMNDTSVQARFASEAQEALRKAYQDSNLENANLAIQTRVTFGTLMGQISNGTAESARDRLTQIAIERNAILDVRDSANLTAEQIEGLNERFAALGFEANLVRELLPDLEDIERRKQAAEERQQAEHSLLELASRASSEWESGMAKIDQIVKDGTAKIADAEKKLQETRLKLSSIDTELRSEIDQLDREFMKDDLQRLEEFIEKERKLKADGNKELLRAAEDHDRRLRDAEINNSTAQFLAEQENFKVENGRRKQDLDAAAQERLESFEAEREKAREVRDERIEALKAEADQTRATLQAELAEREALKKQIENELQTRVITEKNALEASMRNLVNSYDQSTQKMTTTLKAGFDALEAAGIDTFNGIIGELQRRAQVFVNQQASASTPYTTSSVSSGGSSRQGTGGLAFARGTLDTRRAIQTANTPNYMYGDDQRPGWTEAMIPYKQSEGIISELRRLGLSSPIVVDLSGSDFSGSGVTEAQVEGIVRNTLVPVIQRIWSANERVRKGR